MLRKPGALLILTVLLAVVPVWAQETPDPSRARPKELVARYLELSSEQLGQWEELLTTLRSTVEPLQQRLREVESQLAELLRQENPDPAAVGALAIEGHTLRAGIAQGLRDYVHGFEAMLTAEQMRKLQALRLAERLQPLIPAFKAVHLVR